MYLKCLVLIFFCIFSSPVISEASSTQIDIKEEKTLSKKEKKLDELYAKRKALNGALLEIDKEIFELQKEILVDERIGKN